MSYRNFTVLFPSRWLLAALICFYPAAAYSLDPTNTATGTKALTNVTNGTYDTATGAYALYFNTSGSANTSTGADALYNNTTGSFNTASGAWALHSNTTGGENTANGSEALHDNTTGSDNTASGRASLHDNTTGFGNVADGHRALFRNTTGYYNTASGISALFHNTTGNENTASGSLALVANTTGSYNTANGYAALNANTTGRYNVAVGINTLYALNGSNNIALGANAGRLTKSGHGNIYIGSLGINGGESDVMRIGKAQTKTFVAGIAGTALSGATVVVKSNGQLGVVASSARYKQDIKPLGSAAEKLARLRPVSYRYKTEPAATHYGLIAEEVDKVMPELVVRDDQNRPETVQYQELIPLLLHQWKAQQAEVARLRTEIARQHAVNNRQEAALTELRRSLATRLAALDAADRGDRTGSK